MRRTVVVAGTLLMAQCTVGQGVTDTSAQSSTSTGDSSGGHGTSAGVTGGIDTCAGEGLEFAAQDVAPVSCGGALCFHRALEFALAEELYYYEYDIGDINRDGHQDVVLASAGPAQLEVLLGAGACGFARRLTFDLEESVSDLQFVDLDLDGAEELILTTFDVPGPGRIRRYSLGAGDELQIETLIEDDVPCGRFAAADVDLDGVPELLCGRSGAGLMIYRLSGDQWSLWQTIWLAGPSSGIGAADFTGDGLLDVVTSHYYMISDFTLKQEYYVLQGDGKGGFSLAFYIIEMESSEDVGVDDVVAVADFDANGVSDAVLADIAVYMDGPDGYESLVDLQHRTEPRVADFDGDTVPDLASLGRIYRGGAEGLQLTLNLGDEVYGQAVGDLDQDGTDDIVQREGVGGGERFRVYLSTAGP
jgi:hypothetical protein